MLCLVRFVNLSNLRHQRIIRVRVGHQGADREEHLGDGKCWRPLLLQDIQTDGTVRVHIAMIDSCSKVDLGWLEWVICGEMDVQEKYATGIW